MSLWAEALLALFLLTGLMLVASSRLLHCIRIVAAQGILLGILPWVLTSTLHLEQIVVSVLNIGIKGVAMPLLLNYAMRKADVRRELEPLVGYSMSLLVIICCWGISFWVGYALPMPGGQGLRLAVPVAIATMLTGLFMVMARRKAITQVIGFLTFENGVSLFGTGLLLECGLLVELGILLDVFALVFIMGIAVLGINRTFAHIDADRLNSLGDNLPAESAEEGK